MQENYSCEKDECMISIYWNLRKSPQTIDLPLRSGVLSTFVLFNPDLEEKDISWVSLVLCNCNLKWSQLSESLDDLPAIAVKKKTQFYYRGTANGIQKDTALLREKRVRKLETLKWQIDLKRIYTTRKLQYTTRPYYIGENVNITQLRKSKLSRELTLILTYTRRGKNSSTRASIWSLL